MKNKNKIILISIVIVLIIILVLIEVFRVRKKEVETIEGEYQQSKDCPECEWITVYKEYDGSNHWMHCIHCGNDFDVEAHNKHTEKKEYPYFSSDICWGNVELCYGCGWSNILDTHKHEHWKAAGYYDNNGVWHETSADEWDQSGQATCTEKEEHRRECADCTFVETTTIGPLGHDYSKYENIDDAQNHKAICSRCGDTITEAHTFEDVKDTQTCVTPEAIGKQCTKCNYKNVSETKKPTGHKFGIGTHKIT